MGIKMGRIQTKIDELNKIISEEMLVILEEGKKIGREEVINQIGEWYGGFAEKPSDEAIHRAILDMQKLETLKKALPELIDEYIKCYDFFNKWNIFDEHSETEKEAFDVINMLLQTLPYVIANIRKNSKEEE